MNVSRLIAAVALAFTVGSLGGCALGVAGSIAEAGVDLARIPIKAAGAAVDIATEPFDDD